MAVRSASEGILSDDRADKRDELIELLKRAYWMEIETVMSYITNSINPDGVRAQEIIESLQADIQEELGHAQQFANRIKELYGVVPGSLDFTPEQSYLQPPEHQTDIVHVIKGVIEAETGAIEHYNRIIEFTDGIDFVTQDMVIAILRDEEGHRRLFEGYLREYEAEGLAEPPRRRTPQRKEQIKAAKWAWLRAGRCSTSLAAQVAAVPLLIDSPPTRGRSNALATKPWPRQTGSAAAALSSPSGVQGVPGG